MKKKLFTLLTLLLCLTTGAWAAVNPDYESSDWDETTVDNVLGTHGDVIISGSLGSVGNVSGHYYLPISNNLKNSDNPWNGYLGISSSKQIEKISIFYCPNGTDFTNLAWVVWGNGITPNQETLAHGTTTGTTGSKSWNAGVWEDIDLSDTEAYTVYISRSVREFREIGASSNISNFGSGKTINVLGIKVWLKNESAPKYSVTYLPGDGTGEMSGNEYSEGWTFSLPACTFTAPANKSFYGWLCSVDDVIYEAGASYTMKATATTFTAQYQNVIEKTIYSLTGGIGSAEVTAADATVNEGVSLVLTNTAGRIKLTPANGEKFRSGDVITFSGTIGNTSKNYGIKYGSTANLGTDLYVAGTSDPLSVSGTLTLAADADELYIGRYDGSTTTLTSLVIKRLIFTATVTLSSACTDGTEYFGTYSNGKAFVVPEDLTVAAIKLNDSKKMTLMKYAAGDVVPANTGVLVSSATAGDHTITLSSEEGTTKEGNLLLPSGDAGVTASDMGDTDYYYYRLTMADDKPGFWWKTAEGAGFALAANKAYLKILKTDAAEARGFSFGEDETTGVEELKNSKTEEMKSFYNLNGQRVAQPTKGLYIVNGKKVIMK